MILHRFLVVAICAVPFASVASSQDETPAEIPGTDPEGSAVSSTDADVLESRPNDTDLGDQEVTARKWTEDLLYVPESVTVFTGAELEDAGLATVRDAALLVPNVNMTEFTARRLSFPFVRGIGSGQGEPAVTTYVDGVPQLSTGSTNLPLIDLERVEFLRGSQGTLYGRNSIGGVIKMETRRPTDDLRFEGGVNAGNYDLREGRFGYSGPLGAEGLYLDITALYSKRDGYSNNQATGNNVDSRDGFFGRGQLFYRPNENNQLRVGIYGEEANDGGFALSDLQGLRQNPNTINQDFEGSNDRNVVSPSLAYEHFGSSMDFVSITAFTTWDVQESADIDYTVVDGLRRFTDESQDTIYQEFRLQSAEGEDARLGESWGLRWLVGLSGFAANSNRSAATEIRPGAPSLGIQAPPGTSTQDGDFDDLAGAAFGQAAFVYEEKLELTAGLRLDAESKDASLSQSFDPGNGAIPLGSQDLSETYTQPVPKFSAAYRFDPTGQVYVLAAKGFQAGGFNLAAPASDQLAFDSETNWTYELGVKKALADGRVRLAASVYYSDWDEQQVTQVDPQSQIGYVDNVGSSTSKGAELEAMGVLTKGLEAFGSLGLSDTDIDEWVDPFGQNVAGNELPFAPRNTWGLGLQYRRGLTKKSGVYARAEWAGVGEYFYDAGNTESESYDLVNLRLGFTYEWIKLEAWVRNLFDERYVPLAFQLAPGQFVGESAAPRTYGLSLSGSI